MKAIWCLPKLLSVVVAATVALTTPIKAQKTHSVRHPSGSSTYTSKKLHFAVRFPSTWKYAVNGPSVVFAGDKDGNFTPNIVVTVNDNGGQNLQQYMADALKEIRKVKGLQVEDKGAVIVAGQSALAARIYGSISKVPNFEQQQIYCVHGKQGYILALSTTSKLTAKYKAVFDKFVASFQWIKE